MWPFLGKGQQLSLTFYAYHTGNILRWLVINKIQGRVGIYYCAKRTHSSRQCRRSRRPHGMKRLPQSSLHLSVLRVREVKQLCQLVYHSRHGLSGVYRNSEFKQTQAVQNLQYQSFWNVQKSQATCSKVKEWQWHWKCGLDTHIFLV